MAFFEKMNTSAPACFLLPCTISRSQGYSTTTNNDLFNQKEDYDNAQVQLMVPARRLARLVRYGLL